MAALALPDAPKTPMDGYVHHLHLLAGDFGCGLPHPRASSGTRAPRPPTLSPLVRCRRARARPTAHAETKAQFANET